MSWRQLNVVCFLIVCILLVGQRGRAESQASEESLAARDESIDSISQLQLRLEGIDSRISDLEREEKELRPEFLEIQRGQRDLRLQLEESDRETQVLVERVKSLKQELYQAEQALTEHMANNPDYAERQAKKSAAFQRAEVIQQEIAVLANERVQVQLRLQALNKQETDAATEDLSVAEDAGTGGEMEGSEQ